MSLWRAVLAVLSAFFGVRRKSAAQADSRLGWQQVVMVAVVLVACLTGLLVLLVHVVMSQAG